MKNYIKIIISLLELVFSLNSYSDNENHIRYMATGWGTGASGVEWNWAPSIYPRVTLYKIHRINNLYLASQVVSLNTVLEDNTPYVFRMVFEPRPQYGFGDVGYENLCENTQPPYQCGHGINTPFIVECWHNQWIVSVAPPPQTIDNDGFKTYYIDYCIEFKKGAYPYSYIQVGKLGESRALSWEESSALYDPIYHWK